MREEKLRTKSVAVHEPPYWMNHPKVVKRLVLDYLPEDATEQVTEQRIRAIVITRYLYLGRSAENTSEYLAERGYNLTTTAIHARAHKLNHRADRICQELGIEKPPKRDKRRPRFDRSQWERRFRITKARVPAVGRRCELGTVDLAADGDRDAVATLQLYGNLAQQALCKLGAHGKLFFWRNRVLQRNQEDFALQM